MLQNHGSDRWSRVTTDAADNRISYLISRREINGIAVRELPRSGGLSSSQFLGDFRCGEEFGLGLADGPMANQPSGDGLLHRWHIGTCYI